MKDIIDDIKDISIELEDNGFSVDIEPNNDIGVKIISLRTNSRPFSITVRRFYGYLLPFNVNEIKEVFERIIEYVNSKEIDCEFSVSHPNHTSRSRKFNITSGSIPDIGNPKNIMWDKLTFTFRCTLDPQYFGSESID